MHESTAITLFHYPKDSARINCLQRRTLLPSPAPKPNPSSIITANLRNLYALQTIAKQAALISLESSKRSIVAQTQLSTTAFGGSISPLSLPSSQPAYHQVQAGREGSRETSLQNHLFISGFFDVVQHQSGREILAPHSLLSFQGLFGETAPDIS